LNAGLNNPSVAGRADTGSKTVANNSATFEVRNNLAKSRYEVKLGDQVAVIDYVLRNNQITYTHTEVPYTLRGQGIASKMVKAALDEANANGYSVHSRCWFVTQYIERHPEYHSLLV
jgi:predicted GNAT family acetyltransferase